METKSLGQVAYDAYGEQQAWVTFEGKLMPSWESVRKDIQDAWQVAAKAVVTCVTAVGQQAMPAGEDTQQDEEEAVSG